VPTGVLVAVRSALPGLKPAERRVAERVLADPAAASSMSISVLAEQADTSVTTVLRFCRAVGLDGYPQLRLALAGDVAREDVLVGDQRHLGADISHTDSAADLIAKIAYSDMRALEETAGQLDPATLARAADAIVAARRVDVVGIGASGFVGQDLHQKLHRIGLTAFIWTEAHAALTAAALQRAGDVMVVISHSGQTVDSLEPLLAAARRGATTVALTNFVASPIANAADLVLTTAARESPFRSGATVSRIAQLAVVDCLFVAVAQRSTDATVALGDTLAAVAHRRADARRPG
jgi:DNA-binding MurR/RpiR family transcriptional regulator